MPSNSMLSTSKDHEKTNTNKTLPPTDQSKSPNTTNLQNIVGNQELAQIAEEQKFGLSEPEFFSIYETNLYRPLHNKVADKFGVGRRAFRRSKELNDFRQKMKDAARAQANEDITTNLNSNSSLAGTSNISKEFNSMLANKEAYSAAKVSVNSIMSKESDRIIDKLIPEATALNQLKQASLATISSSKNTTLKEKDKKKQAASSAKDKAKELLERFEEPAINEARKIVKGDQSSGPAQPNQAKVDDMTKDVKGQVTTDKIGEKALTKVIETDSVNSGLTAIAPIINAAVPYDGDSASLDFELKIPVSTGVFVIIGLGAEAERDDGHLTVGANIAVGAGVSAGIAEVAVKLGMFIEANGSSTQSALNLISYGMYRNMNARLPSLAQVLWGKGGKSGKGTLEEAEIWAATIEAQEMEDTENYVDVGQSLSASAEVETGVYKGEFEAVGQRYTKYSKESFQTIPELLFGDNSVTTLEALTQKSTRMNQLKTHKKLSASASNELTLPGAKFAISAEGAMTFYNKALKQLEASISVDLPGEIAGFSAWKPIVEQVIPKVISSAGKIHSLIDAKQNLPAEQANNVQDARMRTLQAELERKVDNLTTMLSDSTKSIDPETGKEVRTVENDSSLSLNFGLELGFENGSAGDWKIEFDISKKSSVKIKTGIMTLELEKSRKLFSASRGKQDGQLENGLNFYQR